MKKNTQTKAPQEKKQRHARIIIASVNPTGMPCLAPLPAKNIVLPTVTMPISLLTGIAQTNKQETDEFDF